MKSDFAYKLLDIALLHDKLEQFLLSYSLYGIYSEKEIEEKGFPTQLIMESIYRKFRENPDMKIDQKVFQIFHDRFMSSKAGNYILPMIKELEYQLMCERNKTAPFKLDCKTLLEGLSQNIKTNKSYFENRMVDFEIHNDYLNAHYGHKFM